MCEALLCELPQQMCMCTMGAVCCVGVVAAIGICQWQSKKDEKKKKEKEEEDKNLFSDIETSKTSDADGDSGGNNTMIYVGIGVVVLAGIVYAVMSGGEKNGGKIAAVEVNEDETNWDAADW